MFVFSMVLNVNLRIVNTCAKRNLKILKSERAEMLGIVDGVRLLYFVRYKRCLE